MQKHPIDQLYDLKRELIERVRSLEAHLRDIQVSYPPRIAELSKEADRLAEIFKPLVQQAVDAYKAGAKEEAHNIATERRRIQAQCEELNAQANVLRKEIADTKQAIIDAKQELTEMNGKIERYKHLSHMVVDGFEQAYGVSASIVSEELSVLPPKILRHIKGVVYVSTFQGGGWTIGQTARKEQNPIQTTISLFATKLSQILDRSKLESEYRNSIIHEAGHVLFDWVMSTEQRLKWGQFFEDNIREHRAFINDIAETGKREDFGECFHTYIHNPSKLWDYDPQRYTLIDTIYKEVNA